MALAYHGRDDLSLKRAYAALFAPQIPCPELPRRRGRPHVGVVVTRGHEGVFARCLGGIVERLSAELRVTLVCHRAGAPRLRQLLPLFDREILILPERLDEAAAVLRRAELDLLHYWEVGTDATNYFLPFFQPAPVQCATWGWPVTTGNPRVDYYVSAAALEPEGADAHYSERLVRLPRLPTYYRRPAVPPGRPDRTAWGVGTGERLYLCPLNLRKLHPDFDAVLAELLRTDPGGRLVILGDPQPHVTGLLLDRWRQALGDVFPRVLALPRLEAGSYLHLVAAADVLLDVPYYGMGANTAADALAVGTPAVTLPGAFHRGRWMAGVYRQLGVAGLVATTAADYVCRAVQVAREPDRRAELRRQLLEASDEFFEDRSAVAELEAFFLQVIARSRT